MNNIGQRIKELRKKNDMTQEKLADFLGVTYQSVSKWECGTTAPDLALIVPLARLLHVSTDELLGMKPSECDERKAYFDSEYFQFWKKDHEKDLEIARQAVSEYPGDYRYLYWLASNEWYVGYSDKYAGTDTEKELLAESVKNLELVLENCSEESLRNRTISLLTTVHVSLNQYDEAKKYALMFPEVCRDDLLANCLIGEEAEEHCRKRVKKTLLKLGSALSNLRFYVPTLRIEALNVEETIIKTIISDGNYQHFHISLSLIYEERAKIAMRNGDADGAGKALITALHHAEEYDKMSAGGKEEYTCPILRGYVEDHSNDRPDDDWTMVDYVKQSASQSLFDPIRDLEEFKALFI
ncbi:MAG: helix-turn-helix transcriptional regulator [Clostridia bacterium]|nr:helix-turn-helix transcriptional regulator [Clostridia bacterium]